MSLQYHGQPGPVSGLNRVHSPTKSALWKIRARREHQNYGSLQTETVQQIQLNLLANGVSHEDITEACLAEMLSPTETTHPVKS